ncbi:MAG TPA: DUF6797 domain-containing protein, partial [Humisphaera sp.]|nr:DUF6797 domain-containing protein [Humisphaera sp.]
MRHCRPDKSFFSFQISNVFQDFRSRSRRRIGSLSPSPGTVFISLIAIAWCSIPIGISARAVADEKPKTAPKKSAPGRGEEMDYGPFFSFTILRPAPPGQAAVKGAMPSGDPHGWRPVQIVNGYPEPARTDAGELAAVRGIAVKLGNDAGVCFDADLLSYSAGWTGGFLDLSHTDIAQYKGDQPARIRGDMQFSTVSPGWGKASDFTDPRQDGQGPLTRDVGRYRGLYRNGQKVAFAYSYDKTEILDLPGIVAADGQIGFTRTIHIVKSETPISLNICEMDGDLTSVFSIATGKEVALSSDGKLRGDAGQSAAGVFRRGKVTNVSIVKAPAGATLEVVDRPGREDSGIVRQVIHHYRIQMNLPTIAAPTTFKVLMFNLPPEAIASSSAILKAASTVEDVESLCHGGPALWGDAMVTTGTRGRDSGPYAVDKVTLPEENPFKAWMRTTAVDFFSDGRAAVATFGGDVW